MVIRNQTISAQKVLDLAYEYAEKEEIQFIKCDLTAAIFKGKKLSHISFINCNMRNVEFDGCVLTSVVFIRCYIRNIRFLYCQQAFSRFSDCDAGSTQFQSNEIKQSSFHHSDFANSSWTASRICESTFNSCNLQYSSFESASLNEVEIVASNFSGALMSGVKMTNMYASPKTMGYYLRCPSEGSFTGYKCTKNYIVKLRIPAKALRSSGTTNKCRCSQAKVLGFYNVNGKKLTDVQKDVSCFDETFWYKLGETVAVENFDADRWHECSTGIHFFITFEEAADYYKVNV